MTMPRVALLLNFIPPYRIPVFEALQARVRDLRIFISTPIEPNRCWPVKWGNLDVVVQRNVTLAKRWSHPRGFSDDIWVHVPYDTLPQLWKFAPDVVISGELGVRTCFAAAYTAVRRRGRLVIWATLSEETERQRGRLRERVRRAVLPRADAVLVNGRSGARYIAGFGVRPDRIRIVPQTVDVAEFSRVPRRCSAGDCRVLLFVGRLVERKGLLQLIDALRRWADVNPARRVELRLVGDGPQAPALAAVPVPANLTVRLLGDLPYEDLPQEYAAADAFVLPTLADEWGLVVNEAMAAGLPVLGSRYSQAVEELVVDGENGWWFRPDDPGELFAVLDRTLHLTPAQLRAMGDAGRQRALQVGPSDVADRIAEVVTCLSPT
jgi:glycosyltransferase involved in cell wall biosynthesis